MSTLYLDRRDLALKLEGRALAIYASGERQGTVPTHLLERIVMHSAVALDSSLLARLADDGIAIQLHGGQHGAKVALIHGRGQGDVTRRIGQYRAYEDGAWRCRWARLVVRAKVQGQARFLRQARAGRPDQSRPLTLGLERLGQARTRLVQDPPHLALDSLRGMEGAAAAYFQAYGTLFAPGLGFAGRNRRPPRDPVNATLIPSSILRRSAPARPPGWTPSSAFFTSWTPAGNPWPATWSSPCDPGWTPGCGPCSARTSCGRTTSIATARPACSTRPGVATSTPPLNPWPGYRAAGCGA